MTRRPRRVILRATGAGCIEHYSQELYRHALYRSADPQRDNDYRHRLFTWRCARAGAEQARAILAKRDAIPVRDQAMASIDGRSGLVATEG